MQDPAGRTFVLEMTREELELLQKALGRCLKQAPYLDFTEREWRWLARASSSLALSQGAEPGRSYHQIWSGKTITFVTFHDLEDL